MGSAGSVISSCTDLSDGLMVREQDGVTRANIIDANQNGHDTFTYLTATNQLPGSLPGAGTMVEDAPGEKSDDGGPHTTSLSFVPFTRTAFPFKEQLRESNEKSSNN